MDKIIFSLIQMIISFLLVLLQISTIAVFLIYKNLRHRILYRIMLSISLSDFLQLFAIFQFSFYEYFNLNYSKFIEKFASGIYIIAWDHLIIQHFLLALNRLIIFLRAFYFPSNYKEESKTERWSFNFLLLFSWLIMGAFEILFLTLCSGIWDNNAVGFYYNIDNTCSNIYKNLEFYFTIAFPTISILCYFAIIIILKKSRENTKILSNNNLNNIKNKQINQQSFNKQEKRILIISVLLFSIITALIFAWYLDYKNPPWTMLFLIYLFVNTSLMLIMNSEYRSYYIHMWKKLYRFIFYKESFTNQITDIRNQQQQQTAVVKISSTADGGGGGGTALFLRRNELNNNNNEIKIIK